MDFLKPELVWIENSCYRKLPIKDGEKDTYYEDDLYPSEPNEYNNPDEEECDDLQIRNDGETFSIEIHVPGPLIGMVKGKYSRTINSIMQSTFTSIKLLYESNKFSNESRGSKYQPRNEQGDVAVIKGSKRHSVVEAHDKITYIINSGRWKICDYNHFISIPMNNDEIKEGFLNFKKDVLKNCRSVPSINEDLFEFPSALHLTIVMLTLFDDKEKEIAKAELNKCKTKILEMLGGKTLHVQVKGIEYMNDDPAQVDVLYGKVRETDDDNSLQIIADQLAGALIDVNLARREYDSVKLHVTLMKSRKADSGGRLSFDARLLLERYSDYVFGEMTIKEIHISTRTIQRSTASNRGGYYIPCATITL